MKRIYILLISVTAILTIYFLPYYFLPTDILNYLPSYSLENWQRPHNSLLADPIYQFEPWRHYAKERILNGAFPLWNNLNGSGVPFFANPITAVLYPLQIVYYIFPVGISSWVMPLLKLLLFGFFTYLYFRIINCSKRVGLIGVFTAVFAAFPITWISWPHTNVFILFPLALFLTEAIFQKKFVPHRLYAFLSLTYFFAILGGHPGTITHFVFIHIIYTIIRFWGGKRKIIPIFLSIFLGFLLSSILLFPTAEYLVNSTSFQLRFFSSNPVFLPLKSIIINFVPFIFGAPHQAFYKQLSSTLNFQELASGYVGTSVIFFVITLSYLIRKNKFGLIWIGITLGAFLIAYNVWPFSLAVKLPFLNGVANTRLIDFGAFGITVIFALILEKLKNLKITFKKNIFSHFIVFMFGMSFVLFISEDILSKIIIKKLPEKIGNFYPFLEQHLLLLLFSTLLFLGLVIYAMTKKGGKKRTFILTFLLVPIFIQNILLFWNYNPVTTSKQYYPSTELVKKIESLPRGKILEIGNLNFPPNINLVYNLPSAENDDAVNVAAYKTAFNQSFPKKNQWGKADEASLSSLQKFGVKYVVSDYDINLEKVAVQKEYKKVLPPIVKNSTIRVPFVAKYPNLSQIRLLTANFNRRNTCLLGVKIESRDKHLIAKKVIDCRDIRDFMYYSVSFSDINLIQGEMYDVVISSDNESKHNSIALWGNSDSVPFLETLYGKETNNTYKLLWNKKSVYLWEVPYIHYISVNGNSKILFESSEKTIVRVETQKPSIFEIKRTNFPGWVALVDGRETKLLKHALFIALNVPAGLHVVEVKYQPLSFLFGATVSLLTFFAYLIYLVRQERNEKKWRSFNESWNRFSKKVKRIAWWKHFLFLSLGLSVSTLLFILFIKLFPIHFTMPYTSAINWFTAHKYPRSQEHFYFFSGFLFVFSFTLLLWFIWIKLKKK